MGTEVKYVEVNVGRTVGTGVKYHMARVDITVGVQLTHGHLAKVVDTVENLRANLSSLLDREIEKEVTKIEKEYGI